MMRRLTFSFVVVTLIGALATEWLYASETHSTTITFVAPVHFLMLDGNDVQVPAGTYRIEQAGETQLHLTAENKPSIELQATRVTHEETISAPMAMIVMEDGQEDEIHLILVLSGGQTLDATGSLSGARSRAVSASALRPIQIQSAVNQVKITPPPAQPSPQQMVPAAAIVRVPQTPVGSVVPAISQGTWITWNYLAMTYPGVVAQTLADVQVGKQPISVLAGFTSQVELNDMLRTNWSAELARVNAASALLKQGTVTARGVPASPTKALTPAMISSIPVQLPSKNLGTVWANQLATTVVSVTALTEGHIDMRLDLNATNRHFRIMKVTSYTGRIVNGRLEVAQEISGGQYQDVIVDPYNPPAQISKAGFVSIATRQGQPIDVTIGFDPVALGMTPVGDNQATLTLTGVPSIDIRSNAAQPNWTKIAPIHAYFSGINFGAILFTDQPHTATLTGQSVDMTVLITNAASTPVTGNITAAQLPPGVTMTPATVSVGPVATQRFTLHFKVAGTAQTGTVQPVIVQLNYSNQTRPLTLDMSIYEPWVWWTFGAAILTGVDGAGNKTYADGPIPNIPLSRTNQTGDTGVSMIYAWVKNNGDFWWQIAAYNMKFVDSGGSNFEVYARWNAIGSTDRIAIHIGPRTNPQYYESTKNNPGLATNFLAAVQQGLTFTLNDR